MQEAIGIGVIALPILATLAVTKVGIDTMIGRPPEIVKKAIRSLSLSPIERPQTT